MLGNVRGWLGRFVCTMDDPDLDLLALWAAHTHLCVETYTTPRLILDRPVPGQRQDDVLEHLERLCLHPVQMASLSSPALLTRMLDAGLRTILIDEADRSLSPDKDGVGELLAVLNSGYKRGGTRPVLVPARTGGRSRRCRPSRRSRWPATTRTFRRTPRVGPSACCSCPTRRRGRGVRLGAARRGSPRPRRTPGRVGRPVRDDVRSEPPQLPDGVKGEPRAVVAAQAGGRVAAGGRWPARRRLVDRARAAHPSSSERKGS